MTSLLDVWVLFHSYTLMSNKLLYIWNLLTVALFQEDAVPSDSEIRDHEQEL